MYQFLYYRNYADKHPQVLHDVDGDNQLLSGEMLEPLNGVTTLTLGIGIGNTLYQKLEPIVGLIKVINTFDGTMEFFGRVLKPISKMNNKGLFSQLYMAEDFMSYFNDSSQDFQKIINNGELDFLTKIINNHNSKVEAHKRFKVGRVTMTSDTDLPHRYIGYQSTFKTISEQVIGKIGGYIQIRHERDGMYIDWLKRIGEFVDSPIEAGENIISAERETSFEGIVTRLIPLGADIEQDSTEEVEGVTLIRERLGIASVNGGKNYIDDIELIKQFGIIEREMDWPEIDDETTLKSRGNQYMDGQRAILTTWEVEAVEKSLIDDRFKKFKVGNTHPINNPPMAGVEELQIIEKRTDFLTPHRVGLVIGADKQTLSAYSLQVQEAQKSIQNVRRENNQLKKQLESQLSTLQLQLATLLGSEGNEGTIAELQRQIQEILDQMEGGA